MAAFSVLSRSLHATTSAGCLKMPLGLVNAFFLSSLASMAVSLWWRQHNGRPPIEFRALCLLAWRARAVVAAVVGFRRVVVDQVEEVVGQRLARDLVVHRVQLLVQPHVEGPLGGRLGALADRIDGLEPRLGPRGRGPRGWRTAPVVRGHDVLLGECCPFLRVPPEPLISPPRTIHDYTTTSRDVRKGISVVRDALHRHRGRRSYRCRSSDAA